MEKESKISLLQERLEMVNDRDNELDRVFDYIWDLTRINIKYCPVEGDKVDKHLADIINTVDQRSDSLLNKAKMLFVREAEGVYTYCKKKVLIRNEKERLIIRVGGGYMSLDEFIDTFNPFQNWRPKGQRHNGLNREGNDSKQSASNASMRHGRALGRSLSNCKIQSRSSPRLGVNQVSASKKMPARQVIDNRRASPQS